MKKEAEFIGLIRRPLSSTVRVRTVTTPLTTVARPAKPVRHKVSCRRPFFSPSLKLATTHGTMCCRCAAGRPADCIAFSSARMPPHASGGAATPPVRLGALLLPLSAGSAVVARGKRIVTESAGTAGPAAQASHPSGRASCVPRLCLCIALGLTPAGRRGEAGQRRGGRRFAMSRCYRLTCGMTISAKTSACAAGFSGAFHVTSCSAPARSDLPGGKLALHHPHRYHALLFPACDQP